MMQDGRKAKDVEESSVMIKCEISAVDFKLRVYLFYEKTSALAISDNI